MNDCIRAFLIGYTILTLAGCESTHQVFETRRDANAMAWVKTADARRDVNAAMAHGEFRFYAINGIAPGIVPGVEQYGADKEMVKKYGYRTIAGTSDYSNGDLNQLAYQYAETYNRILLRYLRAKTL